MPRVQVNGFSLHVQVENDGGAPCLLLHGFPDTHKLWEHQVEPLVAAGYRVIAPDLLGLGASDKPEEVEQYSLHRQVELLAGLLDALGVDKVAVVGHDWGAALAFHFAQFKPERVTKLCVMSVGCLGSYFATDDMLANMQQRAMSWYMLFFQFKPAAEEALSANDFAMLNAFGEAPERVAAWKANLEQPGGLIGGLNWYRANITPQMFAQFEPQELPIVQVPTLGVYRDEAYCSEAQMQASSRYVAPGKWRYVKLSGMGHFFPPDIPEELNPVLLDFLGSSDS